jgi:hypothetical protein
MQKAELIITALQQRIGELSAQHAIEIAVLRADFTELQNSYEELSKQLSSQDKENAIQNYSDSLLSK